MAPNATDDALASSLASSPPSSSSSNCSAKCNPAAAVSLREQMLRESYDLINDHLEQSVPSSANHASADDKHSAAHGFVSSSSSGSSSSSPVPSSSSSTSTSNAESSTTSAESSDQEADGADAASTASTHGNSIDNEQYSDKTTESSHADRQNISKDDDDDDDDDHSNSNSEEDADGESSDDTGSGDESEDDAFPFADSVYIQTDEVTLSASDLDRLRSLRPQGGATCSAAVTTISTKRLIACTEAPDKAQGNGIFDGNHIEFAKRPRLQGGIGQISSRQGQHQSTSSRNANEIQSIGRRPSTSRSA